jgi:glycerate kinase
MRVLIANDKFKGSLPATEVSRAIMAGLPASCQVDLCPIADGGEGFTATMLTALGSKWVECDTIDALHRPIKSRYAITDSGLAVMEMASASGFELIHKKDRNILRSSTYGTGLMIRHAAGQKGVERILLGIGGSATNDGGVGMADALGALLLNKDEEPLSPFPGGLRDLAIIDLDQILDLPPIDVACDVDNPVLGANGATAVFGPQKGATPADQAVLEDFLAHLIDLTGAKDLAVKPGAGAAGGLGFGLMYFLNAKLHPGFDLVSEALNLESRITNADVVITGEGSLDAQSLSGKGPIGVAQLANKLGKPVIAVAGHISDEVLTTSLFEQCFALTDFDLPLETLMSDAENLITQKVRSLSDLLLLLGEG